MVRPLGSLLPYVASPCLFSHRLPPPCRLLLAQKLRLIPRGRSEVQHLSIMKGGAVRPTRIFVQMRFGLMVIHQRDLRRESTAPHAGHRARRNTREAGSGGIWLAILVSSRMKTKTAAKMAIFFMCRTACLSGRARTTDHLDAERARIAHCSSAVPGKVSKSKPNRCSVHLTQGPKGRTAFLVWEELELVGCATLASKFTRTPRRRTICSHLFSVLSSGRRAGAALAARRPSLLEPSPAWAARVIRCRSPVLALRSDGLVIPLVSVSRRLFSMRASRAFTSLNSDVVTR